MKPTNLLILTMSILAIGWTTIAVANNCILANKSKCSTYKSGAPKGKYPSLYQCDLHWTACALKSDGTWSKGVGAKRKSGAHPSPLSNGAWR